MEQRDDCCSTDIIDGNGEFNVEGLDNFVKKTKLSNCGLSYAVVAIIGPQSSGKSTLLNHLFHTKFREMDASLGRSLTTLGVSMAKCLGIEPFSIVMDVTGTDSRERGEDDTFGTQTALFALAVADILLINMWCHNVGRNEAANIPLLKTIFQAVMQLFSPPRKRTLIFVLRDKIKSPLEMFEHLLRESIQKIWNLILKPEEHKTTPMSEFFNLEFVTLSNYEEKEERFKQEVAEFRQRFFHSISPGGLSGDRRDVVPAFCFSFSSQQIWRVIKEHRDFDFSDHQIMLPTVLSEKKANEKLNYLESDDEICSELHKAIEAGPVTDLDSQRCKDVAQASWGTSYVREKHFRDPKIVSYSSFAMDVKLSDLFANYKVQLDQALIEPVKVLLNAGGKETWPTIRKVLDEKTYITIKDFMCIVGNFEIDEAKIDATIQKLKDYSQNLVENIAKNEVVWILTLMNDRFVTVFSHKENAMPRVWTGKEDIGAITKEARKEALSLLSTMAAIRLDEGQDNIERTLFSSLMDDTVSIKSSHELVSSSWEGRLAKDVLLTPVQCDSLWRDFLFETEDTIKEALIAEAERQNKKCWVWMVGLILVVVAGGSRRVLM